MQSVWAAEMSDSYHPTIESKVSGSLDQMIHSTAKGMYLTEAEILQGVSAGSFHTVTEKVSDVHEVADQVATQYELLRVFIGVYLLVIMLRFFKGFYHDLFYFNHSLT